jgi:hypothetical protein
MNAPSMGRPAPAPRPCYCYVCRPDAFPPIPDERAPYIAVAGALRRPVPDWAGWHRGILACRGRPLLNGAIPPDLITEACEGDPGWLVVYTHADPWQRRPGHPQTRESGHGEAWPTCPCGSGQVCQTVLHGHVTIQWPPAAAQTRLRATLTRRV